MKFNDIFGYKPVIGMIHLSGPRNVKVVRALEELTIYQDEGVDGAIVEDYHGSKEDVLRVLEKIPGLNLKIVIGINILRDPYFTFEIAHDHNAKFIQLDSVQKIDLEERGLNKYEDLRKKYPNICVLGGIGFKYTRSTGNPLIVDLEDGKSRCDAIVTSGEGTGIETPIEKLMEYKRLLDDFTLIAGSGVKINNVYEQLNVADGIIVGSFFKPDEETREKVSRKNVRNFMSPVKQIRENKI